MLMGVCAHYILHFLLAAPFLPFLPFLPTFLGGAFCLATSRTGMVGTLGERRRWGVDGAFTVWWRMREKASTQLTQN